MSLFLRSTETPRHGRGGVDNDGSALGYTYAHLLDALAHAASRRSVLTMAGAHRLCSGQGTAGPEGGQVMHLMLPLCARQAAPQLLRDREGRLERRLVGLPLSCRLCGLLCRSSARLVCTSVASQTRITAAVRGSSVIELCALEGGTQRNGVCAAAGSVIELHRLERCWCPPLQLCPQAQTLLT